MASQTIGRYEIQSEIGRGGMAAVYLAYDPNFRRNVAVKLVFGYLQENQVFRERFEREAHLIAKIEHPAIVPVYDYGEQDDQLYLVMRYMAGGALTNKIKEGILTLRYTTQIISQIAPALDAVHAQGIVHRDLKPGNILLDNFGNPAISDFGIAHLATATTDLTGSSVVGTPSYMSPEQVRSDTDLDGRSDIYALGVILFEMLTGHVPFQAQTPFSMAMKHLTDPLPSILSLRPDLPDELEGIMNKAMAKDRAMRYTKAAELAHALRLLPDTTADDNIHPSISISLPPAQAATAKMEPGDAVQPTYRSSPPPLTPTSWPSITPTPAEKKRPKRSRGLQIAIFAGLALLLLIVCGSIGTLGAVIGLSNADLFPEDTPTPVLTNQKPETVLFSDDFSDPSSGWLVTQNNQGSYAYRQDGYHIAVNQTDTVMWAKANRQDDDVSIYVDITAIQKGTVGYYGLICRLRDDQNFYYFIVRNTGGFNIGKYKDAKFQPLFANSWQQSDAIKLNNQTNKLRADCVGNTLRLYVNDVMLGEVTDTDFSAGVSALLAAALDSKNFEARFNNFLIAKPEQ